MVVPKPVVRLQFDGPGQFRVTAGKDMSVRVGWRGPRTLSLPQRGGGFQEMRAADFPVTLRRELRPDQFSFFVEDEHRFSIGSDVHAGATPGIGHLMGGPDDPAGPGLDTNQFAEKIAGEQMLSLVHRHGRVADRFAGWRSPIRPEHRGARFF